MKTWKHEALPSHAGQIFGQVLLKCISTASQRRSHITGQGIAHHLYNFAQQIHFLYSALNVTVMMQLKTQSCLPHRQLPQLR